MYNDRYLDGFADEDGDHYMPPESAIDPSEDMCKAVFWGILAFVAFYLSELARVNLF